MEICIMNPAPALRHGSNSSASPGSAPIVFVVNDDESVRDSLEPLVCDAGWEVKAFTCAREFLAHPPALAPSCLILDVELSDLSGLDLQRRLAADRIDMPIIFITAHCDVPMVVQAMKRELSSSSRSLAAATYC
jgi:FixJ family two-component response regulator